MALDITKQEYLLAGVKEQPADVTAHVDLTPKTRWHESAIKAFLFFCGVLSIFTTIGIVVVLGKESLAFFSRDLYEGTNKDIVIAIDESATSIETSASGGSLDEGQVIQLQDELMRVLEIDGTTVGVERGVDNTEIVSHPEGAEIFLQKRVDLITFLTHTVWSPQIGEFGVLPLVMSTVMVSMIAMIVALPCGLGAAIYLSEYASPRTRGILKPVLEILAGIPTVVYGFFALTVATPFLRGVFGTDTVQIYNTAAAGIVVGILIIPLVSSMAEDALHAVPRALREASYGLGATKLETSIKVVIPAALSGIIAAFIVAISRAIGETMIVAIAAGAGPKFTVNPFEAAETMTGHIARISGGDLSYDSIDYNSIFAIGLLLFLMTLALNIVSRQIIKRFREAY